MKYFIDTEFIEDGKTIDLLSIGIVAEDDRTYYAQNKNANFKSASEWVWRNVFPYLHHFSMKGERICSQLSYTSLGDKKDWCHVDSCPWRSRWTMRDEILEFCNPEKFGKPEFWGYYADYDWVAFCQLFGTMVALPKGWPRYCRDIKQWADALGDVRIPANEHGDIHHALQDAKWNKSAWCFLDNFQMVSQAKVAVP